MALDFSLYDRDGIYVADAQAGLITGLSITTSSDGGFVSFSGRVPLDRALDWAARGAYRLVARDGLSVVFDGEIAQLSRVGERGNESAELSAVGYAVDFERNRIRRFYLDRRTNVWDAPRGTLVPARDLFAYRNSDTLSIGAKPGVLVPSDYGVFTYKSPENDMVRRIAGSVDFTPLNQSWTFGFYDTANSQWIQSWTTAQGGTFNVAVGTPVGTVQLRLQPGGTVDCRPGQAKLITYFKGTYYDWTQYSREGASDAEGGCYVGGLPGTAEWATDGTAKLYVGGDFVYETVRIPLGRSRNDQASTLLAKYWNGASWAALAVTDGTSTDTGGTVRTMAQAGEIVFRRPPDWASTTVNGVSGMWLELSWSHRLYEAAGTALPRRLDWHDESDGAPPGGNNDLAQTMDGDPATYNTLNDGGLNGFNILSDYMLWGWTYRPCGFYVDVRTAQTSTSAFTSLLVSKEGDYNGGQTGRMESALTAGDSTHTALGSASMAQDGYLFFHGGPLWRPAKMDGYSDAIYYTRMKWNGSNWNGTTALNDVYVVPDIALGMVELGATADTPILGTISNILMSETGGLTVTAAEIVRDVRGTCPLLSADNLLVQDPGMSINSLVVDPYEPAGQVARDVLRLSDSQARTWYLAVWEGKGASTDGLARVETKPRDLSAADIAVHPSQAISWSDEDVVDEVANYIIVSYADVDGVTQYISPVTEATLRDNASIAAYGRRTREVDAGETTYALALNAGKRALARWKDAPHRVVVKLRGTVPLAAGGAMPAARARAGLRMRRLDEVGGSTVLWVAQTSYDYDTDEVTLTVEIPPDNLDALVARALQPPPVRAPRAVGPVRPYVGTSE